VHVTVATHCSVPDVRRMSREAALEALSRAKLTGRIGHVGEYRQNEVTGQEPRPGTTVECGSVVTISLGVDRGGYW
jgi:beta-lactam-binding protein with PASTA domain